MENQKSYYSENFYYLILSDIVKSNFIYFFNK